MCPARPLLQVKRPPTTWTEVTNGISNKLSSELQVEACRLLLTGIILMAVTRSFILGFVFALSIGLSSSLYGDDSIPTVSIPTPDLLGKPAPDFTLQDITTGAPVSLSEFKGKITIIHFWASWCAPCQTELPAWLEAYRKLRGKNFEWLSVSVDQDLGSALNSIPKINAGKNLHFLSDQSNTAWDSFDWHHIPETLVVDKNGRIIMSLFGRQNWPELSARLGRL
jgi:thiol-disulfide isomerase/thioredoxin